MGSSKESLEKKNIFAEKYDEIRRLDGTFQTFNSLNIKKKLFSHFLIVRGEKVEGISLR